MRRRFLPLIALVLATCLATASPPTASAPAGSDPYFQQDVEYARVGDASLQLNFARPLESDPPAPCIVLIHGGGWQRGHRSMHDAQIRWMAERGFAAASISYRFAPEHRWPAQIEDARAAVRFLRKNADRFHIDPDRIGALGLSAGAHLAMMLGVLDEDAEPDDAPEVSAAVGAVVSFVGPTDLAAKNLPPYSAKLVRELLGVPREGNVGRYLMASPLTHVSDGDAPMLLFCGTLDPLIPADQGFRMAEAMTRAGVPGRVEFLVGEGHGWPGGELDRTLEASLAFFRKHLTPRPAAENAEPPAAPASPGR